MGFVIVHNTLVIKQQLHMTQCKCLIKKMGCVNCKYINIRIKNNSVLLAILQIVSIRKILNLAQCHLTCVCLQYMSCMKLSQNKQPRFRLPDADLEPGEEKQRTILHHQSHISCHLCMASPSLLSPPGRAPPRTDTGHTRT